MEILGSNYGTISFMNYDSKSLYLEKYKNVRNLLIYGLENQELVNDQDTYDEDDEKFMNYSTHYDELQANIERLTAIVFNFITRDDEDDDDADGDCFLLLDEIEKMKSILAYQYQSVLELEQYRQYADQLYFLEREVNKKLNYINYRKSFYFENSMGGRGK